MTIAIAHVMRRQWYGVALCGKTPVFGEADYFVREPEVLETVYNACQQCRDHPDYALTLLARVGE